MLDNLFIGIGFALVFGCYGLVGCVVCFDLLCVLCGYDRLCNSLDILHILLLDYYFGLYTMCVVSVFIGLNSVSLRF